MKLQELRQIIREEVRQVIGEVDKRFGLKRGEYVLYMAGAHPTFHYQLKLLR